MEENRKQNNSELSDKELLEVKNNTRRIILIVSGLIILFVIIFLVIFLFIKFKKDNNSSINSGSNNSGEVINESEYKNFYNYLVNSTNEYLNMYSTNEEVNKITAIAYDKNTFCYSYTIIDSNYFYVTNITKNSTSLEAIINSYNSGDRTLFDGAITSSKYSKVNSNVLNKSSKYLYGPQTVNPNIFTYTSTYLKDSTYYSDIYILDNTNNIDDSKTISNSVSGSSLTLELYKFLITNY